MTNKAKFINNIEKIRVAQILELKQDNRFNTLTINYFIKYSIMILIFIELNPIFNNRDKTDKNNIFVLYFNKDNSNTNNLSSTFSNKVIYLNDFLIIMHTIFLENIRNKNTVIKQF